MKTRKKLTWYTIVLLWMAFFDYYFAPFFNRFWLKWWKDTLILLWEKLLALSLVACYFVHTFSEFVFHRTDTHTFSRHPSFHSWIYLLNSKSISFRWESHRVDLPQKRLIYFAAFFLEFSFIFVGADTRIKTKILLSRRWHSDSLYFFWNFQALFSFYLFSALNISSFVVVFTCVCLIIKFMRDQFSNTEMIKCSCYRDESKNLTN